MPTYSFKRESDEVLVERKLSFAQFQAYKSGQEQLLDTDGTLLIPTIAPGSTLNAVFKDGISGGWASKTYKEKEYRKRHYNDMGKRQRDHVKVNNLIPNYQGQEASSWADVRDEVRTKVGTDAAKTYDALVNQEKKVV